MKDEAQSCLISRMKYYIELNDADETLLRSLEEHEITVTPRNLIRFSEHPSHLFVVKSGWLYSYVDIDDKRRQVLRIHYPGDIVGLSDVAMEQPFGLIRAVTPTVLCPFPKSRLDEIFVSSPRLTALIFSLGMLEQVVLLDRIKIIGRQTAIERVAHFLLEIQARLKIHSPKVDELEFDLPLKQEIIGDAIGLTNVSVSNAMTQLEYEGYLRRKGKRIIFLKSRQLKDKIGFSDRYFRIDTRWFPQQLIMNDTGERQ